MRAPPGLPLLLTLLATARADGPPPEPVRIRVEASRGQIIPQAKGGGGFQRTFRFTAVPGKANRWIRQTLAVRGTVFDDAGGTKPAHLDVVEYYRVNSKGRAIQADSHYSQFWEQRGGDLTITSTLEYGRLVPRRRGDTILGRSFVLKWAKDAEGALVTMRKRTNRQEIPAERGERVEFHRHKGSIPTHYRYRVRWDARATRTQPSGAIERGTWWPELPAQTGHTRAVVHPRPIPLRRRCP